MALERINPFIKEDRFCLDHLLRYQWASGFTAGRVVIDAACGTGFGSELLARTGAARVVGIDRSVETVEACRNMWAHPNLEFDTGSLEELSARINETVGCVVCFETLEHVEHPEKAVEAIKAVLEPGGLLIGSVPGEMDRLEENPYHLHLFTRDSLHKLLGRSFANVAILQQEFHLCSMIATADPDAPKPVASRSIDLLQLDFGKAGNRVDTYIFMASDSALPEPPPESGALSRSAWLTEHLDALKAYQELKATSNDYMRFYSLYNTLFAENGDLQRRFENLLHWGQYHYEKATGREPDEHYLKSIENAQSRRENALYEQVLQLQGEIGELKGLLVSQDLSQPPLGDGKRVCGD